MPFRKITEPLGSDTLFDLSVFLKHLLAPQIPTANPWLPMFFKWHEV
jgi:hypothetical protein